jgi:hypothetical protein
VFVNLPSLPTACPGQHAQPAYAAGLKAALREKIRALGVDVIDLEKDFAVTVRYIGPGPLFSENGCGGHFSETGYRLVGERLLEYLDLAGNEALALPPGWQRHGKRLEYLGLDRTRIVTPETDPRLIWQSGAQPPEARPARVIGEAEQIYAASPSFAALMTGRDTAPLVSTGASIMRIALKTLQPNSTIRVRAACAAKAEKETNELVLALYRNDNAVPVRAASVPVSATQAAQVELLYEGPAAQAEVASFEVRVGVAREGSVQLNPDPAAKQCFVRIQEIATQ